jgi:hypothetical protein
MLAYTDRMRRTVVFGLVLALAGCAGGTSESPGVYTSMPAGGAVFAFVFDRGGRLAELDARTLAERRSVVVGYPAVARARSHEGGRMALASADGAPRITVVDLARMEAGSLMRVGGPGYVNELAWLDGRRLAVLIGHRRPRLLVVDVAARRVLSTQRLTGEIVAHASGKGALVVLVAPRRHIGPARLLVLGRSGVARAVVLGLDAGWNGRQAVPGLAVDPAVHRAVVVAPGRVVEVDLRTLSVGRHELVRHVSLFGRLRNWLEPRADAKGIPGWVRWASFVDSRRIAVTGFHSDGRRPESIGVELVDTGSWRVRNVGSEATGAAVASAAVVAFEETPNGLDVRVLEPSGRERNRLTIRRVAGLVHAAGRYAYLPDTSAMGWQVLDVVTGRVGTGRTSGSAVILEPR